MSPLALALAFLSVVESTRPLELDRVTLDHARALEGKPVVASFIVGSPCDCLLGFTVVEAQESPHGVTRGAVLVGNRLGPIGVGRRIRVAGTMRVLRHAPSFGDELVPEWWEIRVDGSKG